MDLELESSSSVNVDLLILPRVRDKPPEIQEESCSGAWIWKLL